MEPEDALLSLFDSLWFRFEIFSKQPKPSTLEPNPVSQIEENWSEPKVSRQLTIHTRSKSDQLLYADTAALRADVASPDSVLLRPAGQLQTILSDKEMSVETPKSCAQFKKPLRKRRALSKSLSELEFEELKGFMDLGFVFSEEDRENLNLVGILPGLQRLGHEQEELSGARVRTRPYLSEAWEGLNEEEKALMKWRVPAVSNEFDMKDSLKWWAHSVASAVR